MAGNFELFTDRGGRFRIRLTAGDGTVLALSEAFDQIRDVLDVVAAFREIAGTGLIVDRRVESAAPPRTPPRRMPEAPFRLHKTSRKHCDSPSPVRSAT